MIMGNFLTIWMTQSMKVFASLFPKSDRGQGQSPLYAVFGSFCGNFAKKNGNEFLT